MQKIRFRKKNWRSGRRAWKKKSVGGKKKHNKDPEGGLKGRKKKKTRTPLRENAKNGKGKGAIKRNIRENVDRRLKKKLGAAGDLWTRPGHLNQ